MFKYIKPVLFFLFAVLTVGCTKVSPEFGFENLNSDHESLTIESNISIINAATTSSTIVFKGYCENKLNLKLKAVETREFKCDSVNYSVEFSAANFVEGENLIVIESFDDANNKIDSKELRIIKDTVLPSLTLSGPANIASNSYDVPLYGTCSENAVNVEVTELNSNSIQSTVCSAGTWAHTFTFSNSSIQTEFKFSATHKDLALNQISSAEITSNKIILSDYSIVGVATNTNDPLSDLLTITTGSIVIDWTDSSGATNYDLTITKSTQGQSSTLMCQFNGLTTTYLNKVIATECSGLVSGESYGITIEAKDSNSTYSLIRKFNFRTKAAPTLMSDAGILYVNADLSAGGTTVVIPPSAFINDPDSTGPFTVNILNSGGLGSQVVADNTTNVGSLNVTPLLHSSGLFDIQIKITDQYGLASPSIPVKIAIVFPFSWTGFLDNDFNNGSNWCGAAGLKTGCTGSATPPTSATRVMIDDLCMTPRPAIVGSCAPQLSSNTTIKSFYMKSQVFYQNSHSLTIGNSSEGNSYFRLTGGLFNHQGSTGDLTVYYAFEVLGGIFTAPAGSNVSVNTKLSQIGAESIKVFNPGNYVHNNSTLHLLDPQGGSASQYIVLPAGLHLNNLIVNSTGGYWIIKSNDLILDGDLTLKGLSDGNGAKPRLNAYSALSKITVYGNISCEGPFDGGTLPLYIASATSLYRSTYTDCKMPLLKLNESNSMASEDPSSTHDLVLQGLVISAGSFKAPDNPRKLIFKPVALSATLPIIDLASGFDHNGSKVELVTSDDAKNYKVILGAQNSVTFSNPLNLTSFFEIYSDFNTYYFSLAGANPIPLRGSTSSATAKSITLDVGLVTDSLRLNKIIVDSGSDSNLNITTTDKINLPVLELQASMILNGSGNYDLSGSTINLNSFDLTVPASDTLIYLLHTGTGSILGGTVISGQ